MPLPAALAERLSKRGLMQAQKERGKFLLTFSLLVLALTFVFKHRF